MRRIILVFSVFCLTALSFSQDQNTLQYGYISNIESSQYLEMAKKDSVVDVLLGKEGDPLRFQELRNSVLVREDLTKEEKVNLITEIGKIERENIQRQFTVETSCIWVEGAVAGIIRYFTLRKLKVPGGAVANGAVGGAVDALAEKLTNGEFRALVKDGVGKGDWSGLINIVESTLADSLTGAITGKILDKLVKLPPNAMLENTEKLSPKIAQYDKQIVDLAEEIKELKPRCSSLWDDAKNLRNQLRNVVGEERASLEKQLADVESKASQLASLLKEKNALLSEAQATRDNISKTINSEIDKAIDTLRQGKNVAGMLLTDTTFLGDGPVDPDDGVSINVIAEACVEQIANLAFNRPLNDAVEKIELRVDKIINSYDQKIEHVNQKIEEIKAKFETNSVVLKGGVEENVYVDNSTGEIIQINDGDVPANILNSIFADDLAEPRDAQTLGNEAFGREIDKILKDVADGDESLAQKIKDLVKDKIDEAIQKGEDWIENGGIRNALKDQIGRLIDGKLSDADKQHVMNLIDGVCNIKDDGGESLIKALGSDGLLLARDLAINELKKQIADSLPTDQADLINGLLDVIGNSTTTEELKQNAIKELQELVAKYIPYENSARVINEVLQKIADNKAVDVLSTIKDLGKMVAIDSLKDVISKNLDSEVAAKINTVLDGYAKNGLQGVTDAVLDEVKSLIDKYAPGTASAEKLKDVISGVLSGSVTATDIKNATTTIVSDVAKNLIDKANLPPDVADLAKTAIDGLAENGLNGLTDNVGNYIESYVSGKLGDEAGGAVKEIFDSIVTPGGDAWGTILKQAPTIGKAIAQKVLAKVEAAAAKQLDKWIAKCPTLKNILDKLGINGAGIVNGIKNVLGVLWKNGGDFAKSIQQLSQMAVNFLKDIATKLLNSLIQWGITTILNNLVPKAVDWATQILDNWSSNIDNSLAKKGIEFLKKQLEKVRNTESISIKTDNVSKKIIEWIGNKIKPKSSGGSGSTTVLEGGK